RFSAVIWALAPGEDTRKEAAFTGNQRITINPEFFKRLDAKLETLSRAGLLSVIAPLAETEGPLAAALPDDQVALLTRYAIARWGSEPVVWLLEMMGVNNAKKAERWKRIGKSVFSRGQLRPVLAQTTETAVLDQFREQDWVDLLGVQSFNDVT